MKTLIFLCCLAIVSLGYSQEMGNAAKHVGAGVAVGAVGGYAAHKIFNGKRGWTWAGSLGGGLAAGLAKETYDVSRGSQWENKDIFYVTLGSAISGFVLDLVYKNTRRSGGGGKNCGCLVAASSTTIIPILQDNGSRNITAQITAMSLGL